MIPALSFATVFFHVRTHSTRVIFLAVIKLLETHQYSRPHSCTSFLLNVTGQTTICSFVKDESSTFSSNFEPTSVPLIAIKNLSLVGLRIYFVTNSNFQFLFLFRENLTFSSFKNAFNFDIAKLFYIERQQFVYIDVLVQIIFPVLMKILAAVAYILMHEYIFSYIVT